MKLNEAQRRRVRGDMMKDITDRLMIQLPGDVEDVQFTAMVMSMETHAAFSILTGVPLERAKAQLLAGIDKNYHLVFAASKRELGKREN